MPAYNYATYVKSCYFARDVTVCLRLRYVSRRSAHVSHSAGKRAYWYDNISRLQIFGLLEIFVYTYRYYIYNDRIFNAGFLSIDVILFKKILTQGIRQ